VQRRLLARRNQALGRTGAAAGDARAAAGRAGEAAAAAAEAADIVAAAYGEAAVQTAHARRASGRRAPRSRRVVCPLHTARRGLERLVQGLKVMSEVMRRFNKIRA